MSVVADTVMCQKVVTVDPFHMAAKVALKNGFKLPKTTDITASGAGVEVDLSKVLTLVTASGTATHKVMLPDGKLGDIKILRCDGACEIHKKVGATGFATGTAHTITMSALGAVILYFTANGWVVLSGTDSA